MGADIVCAGMLIGEVALVVPAVYPVAPAASARTSAATARSIF